MYLTVLNDRLPLTIPGLRKSWRKHLQGIFQASPLSKIIGGACMVLWFYEHWYQKDIGIIFGVHVISATLLYVILLFPCFLLVFTYTFHPNSFVCFNFCPTFYWQLFGNMHLACITNTCNTVHQHLFMIRILVTFITNLVGSSVALKVALGIETRFSVGVPLKKTGGYLSGGLGWVILNLPKPMVICCWKEQ